MKKEMIGKRQSARRKVCKKEVRSIRRTEVKLESRNK